MKTVFVISYDGTRLMPTHAAKARRLLQLGKAIIEKYEPFTIRLTYQTTENIQPVEIAADTGYLHIGFSVKSEKHEYVSRQYDMLQDETERHNNRRKYRRARRNRLRYRRPRWNNRRIPEKWFAPSVRHKIRNHVNLIQSYMKVCPVSDIWIECGQFDPQVLQAEQEGRSLPEGTGYQHGPRYGYSTLREAVFSRDGYTCQVCGRTPWKDNVILRIHHKGYWQNDRTNRMSNLLTVCSECHTPENHKPGGKLYGLERKVANMASAAFMNSVKYEIYRLISATDTSTGVHITYGAATKQVRNMLNIGKTHADDAYCIGNLHPVHRCRTEYFQKRRRNNRILSKFYDAKYTDSRDGSRKTGSQLANGRTNRNHDLDTENLHKYRQQKLSKGRVSTRKRHYQIQPGDTVIYRGTQYVCNGCHCNGTRVILMPDRRSVAAKEITVKTYAGGWKPVLN